MVTNNGLMRIFWPSDAPRQTLPGTLVGFRNSRQDVFVVAILQNVELPHVEHALAVGTLLRRSPHDLQEILRRCGHDSLRVLGRINPSTRPGGFDPDSITLYTNSTSRLPILYFLEDTSVTAQVVIYRRPNPRQMQYLSHEPISLALEDKTKVQERNLVVEELEEVEESERQRKEKLVQKLKLHKVVMHHPKQHDGMLHLLLEQVNCSHELNALLQKSIGSMQSRKKRAMSINEQVVASAQSVSDRVFSAACHFFDVWIWGVISRVVIIILIAHRVLSEGVLRLLHWSPGSSETPALKDISATAQQIDIRLQQSCFWPIQYMKLRQRKADWASIHDHHPEYIRFYNSLWLVANDIIMGIAVGTFIIENASFVADHLETIFSAWAVEGLRSMISWLMGWPGGLKLNTELAEFLGDLFLWVIDYWAGCILLLRPHLPLFIQLIGFSAFGGATMPISIFSDMLSLFTLHIYSFYVASARIFHWQLTIIMSLFHLFRGKKRNVLRNRIDSCDYDLDQLLLGTILFTLNIFLLPTVFVFYLTFASARVAVIGAKAALEMGLACLNHFPLFAVMLRLKDPGRLPGGICFELQDTTGGEAGGTTAATAYVLLKSTPLSLRAMFESYFELGNRIRKHYFSPSVFLCLASGQFVPPIHRRNLYSLQYSMLPATRVSIGELWTRLTEKPMHAANGGYAAPKRSKKD